MQDVGEAWWAPRGNTQREWLNTVISAEVAPSETSRSWLLFTRGGLPRGRLQPAEKKRQRGGISAREWGHGFLLWLPWLQSEPTSIHGTGAGQRAGLGTALCSNVTGSFHITDRGSTFSAGDTDPPLLVLLPVHNDHLALGKGQLVRVVGHAVVDGFHSLRPLLLRDKTHKLGFVSLEPNLKPSYTAMR